MRLPKKYVPGLATDGGTVTDGGGSNAASFGRNAVSILLRYSIVWALVILAIATNILYPGFFEIANLRNILSQNAPVGLVAIGMTYVLIAGGFDLSVAAIFALAGVCFAKFATSMPLAFALIAALGVGGAAGAINGLIVTRLQVNPFVATLGTASVFGGLAFIYSDSNPIFVEKESFTFLGSGDVFGVPVSIVIFAVAFVVGGLVLAKSVYGRWVYSVGGNNEAARLAGIRVDVVRFSTYVLTGVCAALAGMIIASRTGVGTATVGASITLDAIAMVIIGGTSLLGGEGAMWRTAVGLLILATLNNLFDSLALDSSVQSLVKGTIVVSAVALDSYTRRRHQH